MADKTSPNEGVKRAIQLQGMIHSSWMTQAACVAAQLGIPDLLDTGPKNVEELAEATDCHVPSLSRLMGALVSLDVCNRKENGSFELTPLGSLLRTEDSHSLRSWTIWWGKYLWEVWGHLLYSVKTGENARKLVTGTEGFDHLARDPEAAAVFNRAMVELTRLVAEEVARVYDFNGQKRLVDVGGGYGELIGTVLRAYPDLRGTLFDLPHALEGAKQHLQRLEVLERCELIGGSFFESVPGGADVYLLKSVIHDWDDEKSANILRVCRQAMGQESKLLLIERVMPERLEKTALHQALARSDLNMLVALGGRERTESDFRRLLADCGLTTSRTVPTLLNFHIIEATLS